MANKKDISVSKTPQFPEITKAESYRLHAALRDAKHRNIVPLPTTLLGLIAAWRTWFEQLSASAQELAVLESAYNAADPDAVLNIHRALSEHRVVHDRISQRCDAARVTAEDAAEKWVRQELDKAKAQQDALEAGAKGAALAYLEKPREKGLRAYDAELLKLKDAMAAAGVEFMSNELCDLNLKVALLHEAKIGGPRDESAQARLIAARESYRKAKPIPPVVWLGPSAPSGLPEGDRY